MTALPNIVLLGDLAGHPRGRNLGVSFHAEQAEAPPKAGAVLVFGKEFQTNPERAAQWVLWANAPGRLLILLPPYLPGACETPLHWEVCRSEPMAGGETSLSRMLASERIYEFRGGLLPLERVGGALITAGWRKHTAAGLVVWTALPLWSLTVLDHREACRAWIEDLLAQCGRPTAPKSPETESNEITLTKEEWIMLLHLCAGSFAGDAEALAGLNGSQVIHLELGTAKNVLTQLREKGLTLGGKLTPAAEKMLEVSPYAAFARELRRLSHE